MVKNLCFWSMCDLWVLMVGEFTETWPGKTDGRRLPCASQWGTASAFQYLNGVAVRDSSSPTTTHALTHMPSSGASKQRVLSEAFQRSCQELLIGRRGENHNDIFPTLTPYLSTPGSAPSPSQVLGSKKWQESIVGVSLSNIMNPKSMWIHLTLTRSHSLGKSETLRNSIYCQLASFYIWSCGD